MGVGQWTLLLRFFKEQKERIIQLRNPLMASFGSTNQLDILHGFDLENI
jgi:hypothetical protein